MLDDKLKDAFTLEKFMNVYKDYKLVKTDVYTEKIKIQMGVDGVDWENFEKNLNNIGKQTCKRALESRYFFSPFREIEVPKPPFTKLREARKAGKTRILSVATIKDVIFQKLLYSVIEDYSEIKFNSLGIDVSFAYRRGKSAPLAAKRIYHSIISEQYSYVLDGDIKSFFDQIPHDKLLEKIISFFGLENNQINTYLKRFFSADRVLYSDYNGSVKKYYSRKPNRVVRKRGIPQGGVLSGLIANIFLNDFDIYIVNELYPKYGNQIKYYRYADDFVVLFKNDEIIISVYDDIKKYLEGIDLAIHEIGEKTKKIDLSIEKLEFLGFSISPKGFSIRQANIKKFKNRIIEKIDKSKIYCNYPEKGLKLLVEKIRFKLLGSSAFDQNICDTCGKTNISRNWLRYFLPIHDVRMLRALDYWIKKSIYRSYFSKVKKRLPKQELLGSDLPSLERLYYEYKKECRKSNETKYCQCDGDNVKS